MSVPGWLNPNHWLAANLNGALGGDEVVRRTSRYLRLGMVVLVLGLAASLFFELNRVQNIDGKWCLLGSISAYYYTPVHGFFVGTLVAIGLSRIAIRGNTVAEDTLLNFAGVLAPFVALVPTERAPTNCHPVLDATNRDLNIANNAGALFVTVAAAFLVLGILAILGSSLDKPSLIASLVALAFYVAALVVFLAGRTWFTEFAHPISAIGMFALLGINALVNGYNLYETRKHQSDPPPGQPRRRVVWRFNTYTAIGTFMLVTALVFLFIVQPRWDQWVFGLEAIEIGLFAAFWLVQTVELWDQGLRPALPPSTVQALQAA
jgi:hypothetical protein